MCGLREKASERICKCCKHEFICSTMTRVVLIWVAIWFCIIRLSAVSVVLDNKPNTVFSGQDVID